MSTQNETVDAEKIFRTAVTTVTGAQIFKRRASYHAVCIIYTVLRSLESYCGLFFKGLNRSKSLVLSLR